MNEGAEISRDAWYSYPGPDNDVIMSSRVRFARNLANFPFPDRLKNEDAQRVQSLVFDAFTRLNNPEEYQALRVGSLDSMGQQILTERGVFTPEMYSKPWAGGVIRSDGRLICTVNSDDHIRLSAFSNGLALQDAFSIVQTLDDQLQNILQFAASVEFGYLTAMQKDTGSGIKASVLFHLPSIVTAGISSQVFREVAEGPVAISSWLGAGTESGSSLGAFYLLYNNNAFIDNEAQQIEIVTLAAQHLLEIERGATMNLLETRPTRIKDSIYRAIAAIKYSRFIGAKEGVELLSKIKWGLNTGILHGIEHSTISALLYRIQKGHLHFVIKNGNFNFEKDIISEDAKIERLRSLMLQEAMIAVEGSQ